MKKTTFLIFITLFSIYNLLANAYNITDGIDIGVTEINNADTVKIGETVIIKATVENLGTVNTNFEITLDILSSGISQVSSTLNINNINAGDDTEVAFPGWTTVEGNYDVLVYITTSNDINSANDSLYSSIIVTDKVKRNLVIIEDFTGTWCHYCPGAQMGIEDLKANGYPVAAIANHNGDSYATGETSARQTYYGINSLPTVKFDGIQTSAGGSNNQSLYTLYKPIVEHQMVVLTPIKLEIQNLSYDEDTRKVTADAVIERTVNELTGHLILHAVVTESNIPEEWQTQTELNDVARKYYPNANGTNIDLSENSTDTVSVSFIVNEDWVPELMDLVVFVQNKYSKEIYNGATQHIKEIEHIASITINVIDINENAVEGVTVNFDNLTEITDSDGKAIFNNVEHGHHTYHVIDDRFYPVEPVQVFIGFEDREFTQKMWAVDYVYKETFDNDNLPAGWYFVNHTQNWSVENENIAGGEPNEIKLFYVPNFTGETALASPFIPLKDSVTETDDIYLLFKQSIDVVNNGGEFTLSIKMITLTGLDTTILWLVAPTTDVVEEQKVKIEYSDITYNKVYFEFVFNGSTSKFTEWRIDDFTIVKSKKTGDAIVDNAILNKQISVYPNPVKTILKVNADIKGKLNIYSLTGICVYSNNNFNSNQTIDVSILNQGLYIISVTNKAGIYTNKINVIK
jgi:hypothetical protein